jgi:hypothetical protein
MRRFETSPVDPLPKSFSRQFAQQFGAIVTMQPPLFRVAPGAGDRFYFNSKTEHCWPDAGNTGTLILGINTPPPF